MPDVTVSGTISGYDKHQTPPLKAKPLSNQEKKQPSWKRLINLYTDAEAGTQLFSIKSPSKQYKQIEAELETQINEKNIAGQNKHGSSRLKMLQNCLHTVRGIDKALRYLRTHTINFNFYQHLRQQLASWFAWLLKSAYYENATTHDLERVFNDGLLDFIHAASLDQGLHDAFPVNPFASIEEANAGYIKHIYQQTLLMFHCWGKEKSLSIADQSTTQPPRSLPLTDKITEHFARIKQSRDASNQKTDYMPKLSEQRAVCQFYAPTYYTLVPCYNKKIKKNSFSIKANFVIIANALSRQLTAYINENKSFFRGMDPLHRLFANTALLDLKLEKAHSLNKTLTKTISLNKPETLSLDTLKKQLTAIKSALQTKTYEINANKYAFFKHGKGRFDRLLSDIEQQVTHHQEKAKHCIK